ncbi:lysophospholipase [Roseivivax halodurans JCM 10272]|uniref:Lysophospholipase n=1 Tax=Roseivivax halodurans JCM 10272 TaxID=1449350 RepID=X7ELV4_9RHOB|nr:lysophospholipase [Roseivivax halodurans JCM 10272]
MRWLARIFLVALLAVAATWAFGPRESRELGAGFDTAALGEDLDEWLAGQEARFDDIVPGTEKRIVWAGAPGQATDWALIYVHGFSASSEEVRPLPDNVAEALGANLYYTRLAGHGRDGAAMAEPELADWMADMGEAMAIGRRIGNRVLVISTSTGGTLSTLMAADPEMSDGLAGLALISPNYLVANSAARMLTWPGAEWWVPLVVGRERGFTPVNAAHARYWTERYPTVAVLPMAASVAEVRDIDYASLETPALFIFSPDDRVVDAGAIRHVADAWGGPAETEIVRPGPGTDPSSHVLAGEILSPALTEPITERIVHWVGTLPSSGRR